MHKRIVLSYLILSLSSAIYAQNVAQPATTQKQSLEEMLQVYNSFMGTYITTQKDLYNDMSEKIKFYFSSIRACTPGTIRYALIFRGGLVLTQATIYGFDQAANCKVGIESPSLNATDEGSRMICSFTPASSAFFSEEHALAFTPEKIMTTSRNTFAEFFAISRRDCRDLNEQSPVSQRETGESLSGIKSACCKWI